jgi:hypothetical protein
MNAKQVLNKIIATLSLSKEEVVLAYAKLADGTILESPTFDVGEEVSVVSEDGTKTAAPNGEHEIVLKDSEGNEVRIKVITKDGVIAERENVELPMDAKSEEVPVEELPESKVPKEKSVYAESIAGEDIGESTDEVDETAEPITEDMSSAIEKMQYRISELEKLVSKLAPKEDETSTEDAAEDKKEADVQMAEEEELPKLNGAPIEENPLAKQQNKFSRKVPASPQNSFLSRLYK